MEAIVTENLVKQYKSGVLALDRLNLSVKKGEIFTLLGPNGAGKSTLIRILTTYSRPTSGTVRVLGADISRAAAAVRSGIACVAQQVSVDEHLSLAENMMFQARICKVAKCDAQARMEYLTAAFGLNRYLDYPVVSYSGGIKRRLDIALNMMSNPQILFLDEPTTGMDIRSRIAMWEMLRTIKAQFGTTILLTTHYLEEADQLSDTICVMKHGRELIQGTADELRSCLQQERLVITFKTASAATYAAELLTNRFPEFLFRQQEARLTVAFVTGGDIKSADSAMALRQVNYWLLEQQISFSGMGIEKPSLDDIFLQLTKDDGEGQDERDTHIMA